VVFASMQLNGSCFLYERMKKKEGIKEVRKEIQRRLPLRLHGEKMELDTSEVVFVDLYLFGFCFYQKAETAYQMDSHNAV